MKKFIDEVYFEIKAGDGGAGTVSFERFKFQPVGKPAGGDGGRGGHVIFRVDSNLSDLYHLRQVSHVKAGNGRPGGAKRMTGRDGADEVVRVPAGVIIREYGTGQVLKELLVHDEEYLAARGGRGGKGNFHFKSSTNRSPHTAQKGESGASGKIIIELKLLAEIGLVGFPNAGKSTLLEAMTEARPEIAGYPFTTLAPNLGVLYFRDGRPFRMADIPGLIEDSHKGKGLGIQFLKHIERTGILCMIVDVSEKDHEEKLAVLRSELKKYDPGLLEKQILLVGNKTDLLPAGGITGEMKKKYVLVSALNRTGLEELKMKFEKMLGPVTRR